MLSEQEWADLMRDLRNPDDADLALAASERLQQTSGLGDVSRLRELLKDESVFIRAAAAWPLSELLGPSGLPELFEAYQRGIDEGQDNDGFTAALVEMVEADPEGMHLALETLSRSSNPSYKENALWLRAFCAE